MHFFATWWRDTPSWQDFALSCGETIGPSRSRLSFFTIDWVTWPYQFTDEHTHTFLQPLCHFVQKNLLNSIRFDTSDTSKFKSWTEKTWRLLFVLVVLPISCFQGGGFPRASQAAVTCLEVASDCSADVSVPKHQHRGLGHSTPEMVWTTESPWRHQVVRKVFARCLCIFVPWIKIFQLRYTIEIEGWSLNRANLCRSFGYLERTLQTTSWA
jgi:hypothetical protein